MEIPFTHMGHKGSVNVSVATTLEPASLGARDGALGLANCTATIEFDGSGYLRLLGWVQLVRSSDNLLHRHTFEIDPFDPFGIEKHALSPYCWYGIAPTLFDAPSRDLRVRLDWEAHSFLAASPLRGNRRAVMPLLGFAWGFEIAEEKNVTPKPVTPLSAADWDSHLPYLRKYYKKWQFTEMLTS